MLPTHSLLNVECRLDGEHADAAKKRDGYRDNEYRAVATQDETTKLLKPSADVSFETLRYVYAWLAVFSE